VGFTIYTPGSTGGVGLNIVGSLEAPAETSDLEVVGDEIEGFVSGLLGLVGIEADPLSSREHILLSNLILHEWTSGRSLDLAGLLGLVVDPPVRKLGVFEIDQFFPAKDRTAFAMRLNGLLASPSFAAWMAGPPLDIASMLFGPDGRPQCAIVTTSHLSDEERQFVTTLVLSKLATWMRRQSGTTDLRALLYMDEVVGYLPPTANPPTKKPIMTLLKQARAFGVGVVVATQNPVDVDYKALSNAGTWMIGRLQTDQDKQRLLDGMSTAGGGVDVRALGDIIAGLPKRAFVLRRAGRDQPELFTTRWAMAYLRGPLTRDQIAVLMADQKAGLAAAEAPSTTRAGSDAATTLAGDEIEVLPDLPADLPVRWSDPAAPWLTAIGGDPTGTRFEPALVARVALRYDDDTADLVHDEEYEAVLFPLGEVPDPARAIAVDHDDRDLRTAAPAGAIYRLGSAPIHTKAFVSKAQRALIDHLVRSRTLTVPANRALKLVGRPGEGEAEFAARCAAAADAGADAATAKLQATAATKVQKLRQQIDAAADRVAVLEAQQESKQSDEILSVAGAILDGLFGGRTSRKSVIAGIGRATRTRGTSATASERTRAAHDRVTALQDELASLEQQILAQVAAIDAEWAARAAQVEQVDITLERTDVQVTQFVLAWIPVP
jgi:hypothetical protein